MVGVQLFQRQYRREQEIAMTSTITNQVSRVFSKMTTAQLCEAFEATNSDCDASIPQVREWIIDELERRDQNAFDAWMDCQNSSMIDTPSVFFK
jgi:hypothetical protein